MNETRRGLLLVLCGLPLSLSGLLACSPTASAPPAPLVQTGTPTPFAPPRCVYRAELIPPASSLEVEVTVRCTGWNVAQFAFENASHERFVTWHEQDGEPPGHAAYRMRVAAAGKTKLHHESFLHLAGQTLAPLSSWLAAPVSAPKGTRATLHVSAPKPLRFDIGMSESAGHYDFRVSEIRVGSYGRFSDEPPRSLTFARATLGDTRSSENPAEAKLQLAILPGRYQATEEQLYRWTRRTAAAVAEFYSGLPARKLLLTIVPVPGRRGVLSGKLLPAAGPGILLLLGEETVESELYEDWILTHELFHLGVPSFLGEGKWLDEGLATYFEPLIRHRAGWLTEAEVWSEFAREMPQGLPALELFGLAHGKSYKDRYWGGAVFSFLADFDAIQSSACSLQHALVAALADGAEARAVWDLNEYVDLLDEKLGIQVIRKLFNRHTFSGTKTEFEQHLGRLGVKRSHFGVTLDDRAELADVRRLLSAGVKCREN